MDEEIKVLEGKLKHFPEGKLVCNRNGEYCKWYCSDGHHWTYIPKKKREFAEALAVKKYVLCQKEYMEQEKLALERYMEIHPEVNEAEQMLSETSEYQKLLEPYFMPISKELSDWAEEPYEKNSNHPEHLTQKTGGGTLVRSKSEAMIDMALRFHKIPFRYECLLELGGISCYPDFTIRHPKTGEIYYWEHFGKMDDPIYAQNALTKLKTYISHGLIPSINLITTYETKDEPLNMEMIEKIIDYHFK